MTQPQAPVQTEGIPPEVQAAMVAAMAVVVLSAIQTFLDRAHRLVFAQFSSGGSLDPQAIQNLDGFWTELVDGLMPDLLRAMRTGWLQAARDLGLDIPFDPSNPIIQEQVQATRNLLVNIDSQIYEMVVRIIADGMDQGWTRDEIADRVDEVLSVSGSPNWPNRAQVIAQTEVGRFARAGEYAYARTWSLRTGRRLVKVWVDRDDNRVRPAHRRADGQVRELTELFDVGGSMIPYPGHWSGLPHDVINERCAMVIREARRAR